jgi:hypothetical protein
MCDSNLNKFRIGNNANFIYENHPDEFYNLFGSQTRKRSIQAIIDSENKRWGAYPLVTCADADMLHLDTETEIALQTKKLASSSDFHIQPTLATARDWQAKADFLKNHLNCDAIKAAADLAAANQAAISQATSISDTTVAKAAADLSGATPTATPTIAGVNQNLLIYGGVGLGVLVVLALLFKK